MLAFSSLGQDPAALLRRAERIKEAWPEVVITLNVTTTKPGAAPAGGNFSVEAKGNKSRIRFLNPADAGKSVVQVGDEVWLVLPNTKNPIRVPRSHRLTGGFSAADMARTRFVDDYDAVLERTDVLKGMNCAVLRLTAKAGKNPSYPIVRVWIDEKEGLYRKAVFLVSSGKTARETAFDEYRAYHGILSLAKMTIVDTLRPGTTVVEYLDYEKKSLPDSIFEVRPAAAHSAMRIPDAFGERVMDCGRCTPSTQTIRWAATSSRSLWPATRKAG